MDVEGKLDDVGHLVQKVCGPQGEICSIFLIITWWSVIKKLFIGTEKPFGILLIPRGIGANAEGAQASVLTATKFLSLPVWLRAGKVCYVSEKYAKGEI